MRTAVIVAGFVTLFAVAAYKWWTGLRSEWENAAADAVVHDLAESTRRLHGDHVAQYSDFDGGDAA